MRPVLLAAATTLSVAAHAQELRLPNPSLTPDQVGTLISPTMGSRHQNQPGAIAGALFLGGNAIHEIWDVSDPFKPARIAELTSPHHDGEAESHQLAFARVGGRVMVATISGRGVDLWDLTDLRAPVLLAALELDGVDYGDNSEAVWGVSWQGRWLYVGGTSTGLHVVDTLDPTDPQVVARRTVPELGGVSAGPLWAVGNRLIVTTPKEHAGIATLDVSDPADPFLLDAILPERKSYIGGFYGAQAWLLSPLRSYDVLGDDGAITPVASLETLPTEYVSFGDGRAFVGRLRPDPGAEVFDVRDPRAPVHLGRLEGRKDDQLKGFLTDDQFTLPVGNLVVLCDEEVRLGCVLSAWSAQPDTTGPEVLAVQPADGAARQAPTTRIGLSLSDNVDLARLDPAGVIVRPIGGAPLAGSWGVQGTVLAFSPDAPLALSTSYEIEVPAGGLVDLVGNPSTRPFFSAFSTGDTVVKLACDVGARGPGEVGAEIARTAADAGPDASYTWAFGDGSTGEGREARHAYASPGRYPVRLTVRAQGAQRTCAGTQVVHRSVGGLAPASASTVVSDATRGLVWVVNPDADTVTAVDARTLEVRFEVPVGDHPRTVAVAPDGTIWVTGQDSDDVTVLDGDSGALITTIGLRHGGGPYAVVADASRGRMLVTLQHTGELLAFDDGGREVTQTVALPGRPPIRGLAVSGDGEVYVTRYLSPPDRGEVYRIAADLGAVEVLSLAYDLAADDHDQGRGVPNLLSSVALSPDGQRAAVPSTKANLSRGTLRDGERLDSDNTVRTIVSFVDLAAAAEADERIDLDDHDSAFAATYSPRGDLVFVASQGTNRVDVRDAYDGRLVSAMSTGLAPNGVLLDGEGRLWVQELNGRTLSVFDVSAILAGTDAVAVPIAVIPTVAVEPLAPDVLLGKRIFANAGSREMSADGYLSCASCHPDGGEDGQVWDFTDRGEGLRNTIDLRGRAGTGHGPVHWTANFDEIQDFEHDIRAAFGGSGLMTPEQFADGRDTPLGAPKAGVSARLDALAAYVASLDTFPRSPYRNADGSLTADAEAGRRLLDTLACLDCHAGPALTDSAAGVRHDVGTITPASGQRIGGPLDGLDTPTLLGLWASPPYLHDGSAATVEEVLARPGHGADHLSADERRQLAALLLQLEDHLPEAVPAPEATPSEEGSCGCRTGVSPTPWPFLLALVGLRRRRGR